MISGLPGWEIGGDQRLFRASSVIRLPQLGSAAVAERLAKEAGVVCLPGSYFGGGAGALSPVSFRQCRCGFDRSAGGSSSVDLKRLKARNGGPFILLANSRIRRRRSAAVSACLPGYLLLGGLQQIELPPLLLRHNREVDDLLQVGGMAEGRIVLLAGPDRFGESADSWSEPPAPRYPARWRVSISSPKQPRSDRAVRAMDDLEAALSP